MKNTCLVLGPDMDRFEGKFESLNLPDLKIILPRNESEIRSNIGSANIIFGEPPIVKNYISEANNLEWYQSNYAGVDAMIGKGFQEDYILTNVKDTYGQVMAEYVLAYILNDHRDIDLHKEYQQSHTWNSKYYDTIDRKKVGIVGTGSIGKDIARVLKFFGMEIRGMNTSGSLIEFFDSVFTVDQKDEFFDDLDYVVSVLPFTPDAKYFFDSSMFESMDKKSVFMNIGRGGNVCEEDLMDALTEGEIVGAVLDVFEKEPLSTDSPLWDMNNVTITAHVSGHFMSDMEFNIFEENYNLFCAGEDLKYQIDFNKGY